MNVPARLLLCTLARSTNSWWSWWRISAVPTQGHAHEMGSKGARLPILNHTMVEAKLQAADLIPLRIGAAAPYRGWCVATWRTTAISAARRNPPELRTLNTEGSPSMIGQWLESSILHLVEEAGAGHAGSEAMLAKLSEALTIEILRRHAEQLPERRQGRLAGARDPVVGKSLSLLRRRGADVGMSHPALVERFTRYLAEPPMADLRLWRPQLAARALAGTSRGVADIAAGVGYDSEAAFNRAFKPEFGHPPRAGAGRARIRAELAAAP